MGYEQNLIKMHDLARLMISGKIETVRFGTDGCTAIIKYKVGRDHDTMIVEKRVYPTEDSDGTLLYDMSFLNLTSQQ